MSENKVKSRQLAALWANNMRIMQVICPECGAWAKIRKTNRKHRQISDIYCACDDIECGHTFVLNVIFSHTLSPSAKSKKDLLKAALQGLNQEQHQFALDLLKTSLSA